MFSKPSPGQAAGHAFRWLTLLAAAGLASCRIPEALVAETDLAAYEAISDTRREVPGASGAFTIDDPAGALRKRLIEEQRLAFRSPVSLSPQQAAPVPRWSGRLLDPVHPGDPPSEPSDTGSALILSMVDALRIAAENSRDYQSRKENVYRAALSLDLRRYDFSTHWSSLVRLSGRADEKNDDRSLAADAGLDAGKRLQGGALLSAGFTLNFLEMLSGGGPSSLGVGADSSVTIPLLRGSGRHIAREPLTQAERNLFYEVCGYERYKHLFVVGIADQYLDVLRQFDAVQNADENYRRLQDSVIRSAALAEAGRMPEIQVDQARQKELRARAGWIQARQSADNALDRFKTALGLPPDASIRLDPAELSRVLESGSMPDPDDENAVDSWLDGERAVEIALARRFDLLVSLERVADEQRQIVIAVDRLRPEVTLGGRAQWSAAGDRSDFDRTLRELRSGKGLYTAFLHIDPGFDRTLERIGLRNELIDFRQAVRRYQETEDNVKLDIRRAIRALESARERVVIQRNSIQLAERRVASSELFLQAGRAEIRDLLDARSDLLDAKNGYTSARIAYRLAFLELQRDLGLLEVDERGLWTERNYRHLLSQTDDEIPTGHES